MIGVVLTHLLALCVGLVIARAYSVREITKIKRDDLTFRMAPVISNSADRC
jgi:hypothetical protein